MSQQFLSVQPWLDRIHRRQQEEQTYLAVQFKLENHIHGNDKHTVQLNTRENHISIAMLNFF